MCGLPLSSLAPLALHFCLTAYLALHLAHAALHRQQEGEQGQATLQPQPLAPTTAPHAPLATDPNTEYAQPCAVCPAPGPCLWGSCPVHVLYLGPQVELDMLDTFSELPMLLPGVRLHLHFIGPHVPPHLHGTQMRLRPPPPQQERGAQQLQQVLGGPVQWPVVADPTEPGPPPSTLSHVNAVDMLSWATLLDRVLGGGQGEVPAAVVTHSPGGTIAAPTSGLGSVEVTQQAGVGAAGGARGGGEGGHSAHHHYAEALRATSASAPPPDHASATPLPLVPPDHAGATPLPSVSDTSCCGAAESPGGSSSQPLLLISFWSGCLHDLYEQHLVRRYGLSRANSVIVAPNAGLAAYNSWQPSLQLLQRQGVGMARLLVTDYCEEALVRAQLMMEQAQLAQPGLAPGSGPHGAVPAGLVCHAETGGSSDAGLCGGGGARGGALSLRPPLSLSAHRCSTRSGSCFRAVRRETGCLRSATVS